MPIPNDFLLPGSYVANVSAVQPVAGSFNSVLLIGPKTSAGTAADNVPVLVESASAAQTLFGARSVLSSMCQSAFAQSEFQPVYALPHPDAGSARTVAVAITGTGSAAGQLVVRIGGRAYAVSTATGTTATEAATGLLNAVNNDATSPFTATASAGTLTLAGANGGTELNSVSVESDASSAPGFAAADTNTAGTDGGTNEYTNIAADISGQSVFDIYVPANYEQAQAALNSFLETAWSGVDGRYGAMVACVKGSQTELLAVTTGQERWECVIGYENEGRSGAHEVAAAAAQRIRQSIGENPVKPVTGRTLNGIDLPPARNQFSNGQINALLGGGGSGRVSPLFYVAGSAQLGSLISSIETGGARQYITETFTTMIVAREVREYLAQFVTGGYILVGDEVERVQISGARGVRPMDIKAGLVAVYSGLVGRGLADDLERFTDGVTVVKNLLEPTRVDIGFPLNIGNAIRQVATQIEFTR